MNEIRASVDCNPDKLMRINIKNSYKINGERNINLPMLTHSKRENKRTAYIN